MSNLNDQCNQNNIIQELTRRRTYECSRFLSRFLACVSLFLIVVKVKRKNVLVNFYLTCLSA